MRSRLLPYILLSAAALFWGANFVVGRALANDVPPVTMNFWRFFGALIILLPFTLGSFWASRRVVFAHWPLLLVLGVTGISAFSSFVYIALTSTEAINAALFIALTPLVIPLFAYLVNGDAPSRRQIAGICLSFIGVLILVSRGDFSVLSRLSLNRGDLWMFAAVPLWSLYVVLLKRSPAELPRAALLISVVGAGVVSLIPLYLWEYSSIGGFVPTWNNVLGLAFVAVFPSALAYLCWNQGVDKVGATRAGPFMHLVPVFATILAIVFLGESFRFYHLVGGGLIAFGLVAAADGRLRNT